MRRVERMVEGTGFYLDTRDDVPTYGECLELIRLRAYEKWQEAGGMPDHALDFWLQAEQELFLGRDGEGYDVYVCDMSRVENKGFFRYWDMLRVTPQGSRPI